VKIVDKRVPTKGAHEARDPRSSGVEEKAPHGIDEVIAIGATALCTDGQCGQVRCVVVDPVARDVTHVVVETKHRKGLGRLVPLDLLDVAGDQVTLHCDLATFEDLELAEQVQFMPRSVGYSTYKPQETLTLPYYGLGLAAVTAAENPALVVTHDTLPLGEVGVHRGDCVRALDGEIGKVEGLVIERLSHHVTHVLLQEGHLWGRRDVAIPIHAVTTFEGGIQLDMSKSAVQSLPLVVVEHGLP
jgi:hypothetical protein